MYQCKHYQGFQYNHVIIINTINIFCFKYCQILDVNTEIQVNLKHHFKLNLKSTEAAHRIQEVKENKTLSDHIA